MVHALLKNQRFICFDAATKLICKTTNDVSDRDAVTQAQLLQSITVAEADSLKVYKKALDKLKENFRKELIEFVHTIQKQFSKVNIPKEKYSLWRKLWTTKNEQPEP